MDSLRDTIEDRMDGYAKPLMNSEMGVRKIALIALAAVLLLVLVRTFAGKVLP